MRPVFSVDRLRGTAMFTRWHEGTSEPAFERRYVFRIPSTRAMRLLAVAGMVAMAWSSLAQNNPPRQFENNPPKPFQETAFGPVEGPPGVETPQRLIDEIESFAKKREEANGAPLERESYYTIFHARDAAEF